MLPIKKTNKTTAIGTEDKEMASTAIRTFIILQEPFQARPGELPRTLKIPMDMQALMMHGPTVLCNYRDDELLAMDIKPVLPDLVLKYGLRNGDLLFVETNTEGSTPGQGRIVGVNHIPDPTKLYQRPVLTADDAVFYTRPGFKPQVLEAAYPDRPWHLMCAPFLDDDERRTLRAVDIMAVYGMGASSVLKGPAQTGKSVLLRSEIKAWIQKTLEMLNLYVIIVSTGERQADHTEIKRILQALKGKYAEDRVFEFSAPDRSSDAAQSWLCSQAVAMASALTASGKHVVLLIDSASRWLLADSSAVEISNADTALISGGVKRGSIGKIRRLLALAGNYGPDATLTIRSTMLWLPEKDPRARAYAEGVLATQIADSSTNQQVATYQAPNMPYPSLNMESSATSTRMEAAIRTPLQLAEAQFIRKFIWSHKSDAVVAADDERGGTSRGSRSSGPAPEDALWNLVQVANDHPFPPETSGWDGKLWWKDFK